MTNESNPYELSADEPLNRVETANRALAAELAEARSEQRPLSDDALRELAAHVLLPTARTSGALHRLRLGESTTLADLTPEALAIASDPTTPPTVRNALDWIATTLLLREHPELELVAVPLPLTEIDHVLVADQLQFAGDPVVFRRRAGLPVFYRQLLEERLTTLLGRHGHALQAFLSLSDVDADEQDLSDHLSRVSLGNYDDIVDAVTAITPYFEWDRDLTRWAHTRGLDDLIHLDHDGLTDRAYEWWRVAEVKGRTYVFRRD